MDWNTVISPNGNEMEDESCYSRSGIAGGGCVDKIPNLQFETFSSSRLVGLPQYNGRRNTHFVLDQKDDGLPKSVSVRELRTLMSLPSQPQSSVLSPR